MRADIHFHLRTTLDAFKILAGNANANLSLADLKVRAYAMEAQYNLRSEVQRPVDNDSGSDVVARVTAPLRKSGTNACAEHPTRSIFAATVDHMRDYLDIIVPTVYVPQEVKRRFETAGPSAAQDDRTIERRYLLNAVFGDGEQLYRMMPVISQPSCYAILVDSSMTLDDCLSREEIFCRAIQHECGLASPAVDPAAHAPRHPFPALDSCTYTRSLEPLATEIVEVVRESVQAQVAMMTEAHRQDRLKTLPIGRIATKPSPR